MTVTFDSSLLTSWYSARSGLSSSALATAGKANSATPAAPTAPWTTATPSTVSDAAKAVLAGGRFIDPTAAKLTSTGGAATDYRDLFALHQGLTALEGLAQTAQASGGSSQAQARFAAGLKEVQAFLASAPFQKLAVASGAAATSVQGTVGVKSVASAYVGATVSTGSLDAAVPGLDGATAFDLTVTKGKAAAKTVHFDLSELNGAPRTLPNVVSYLNAKLTAAGLDTRFAVQTTAGQADTFKGANGQTITLAPAQNSYALKLTQALGETLSFSAPDATLAVYLASSTAATVGKAASTTVSKLDGADGEAAKLFGKALPANVGAVHASAIGPDGAVYLLADVTGKTDDGQTLKGAQDVALIKLDSAGQPVFTRTLGAAASATGLGLAVSADGHVAVTGSVTGALDAGDAGVDATLSDSFVTLYDKSGIEQWTQRRGAAGDDSAAAVAFGSDGAVYVTGTAKGSIPGGGGSADAYLQGFSAKGTPILSSQFGSSASDKGVGLVVVGNTVVTASNENGRAVLRRFDLPGGGTATPSATRDLGDLGGGELAGVGVDANGRIVVAGSTRNGALAAGAATGGFPGGKALFAASLDPSLAQGGQDAVSYVDPGGDATATAFAVSAGGQLYLAGQAADPSNAGAKSAFALSIDPESGAVGWSEDFGSADSAAAPTTIAVDSAGASALDRLGLPRGAPGAVATADAIAGTSLRAGDQFTVAVGGQPARTVTIDAGDTLADIAASLNRATGFQSAARVTTVGGYDKLTVAPANSSASISIGAGPAGRNALPALGLAETTVTATPPAGAKTAVKTYGLGLTGGLSITDAASAKAALAALTTAITTVRGAYTALATPPSTAKASSGASSVSAYQSAQIANWQQALARLTA